MYAVKSTLPEPALKVVADALQGALADIIDLSLVAKQVHWNVIGPRFRTVHLQLDDVVETARAHSDIVAERASALGISPDGRAATVAGSSGIATVPEGWLPDTEAVDILTQALGSCIVRMRDRMVAVGEVDRVTEDNLIALVKELEKHHWMFQAENGS
ncbi:DNA starvation/stationary phase protection protein [Streptomyces sp. JH002]|uniref:Ferritin n=1 Tax=Streptomyces xiamenensis TaxID=408015 RepID=A0A0F7FY99_9ACTN|nr:MULTISPECIES: DNA starvation/stationary phase protection protein [Streptomyces]AKG45687.1 ferritin [Streptomyces xiamenensis]MCU4749408.1 DNA starvation/stationary phase protection protein [Streptomyces sp. G-5]QQN77064.1 DNA starvation/stationary phase protection protein [Streptomyces sp. XC 2026]